MTRNVKSKAVSLATSTKMFFSSSKEFVQVSMYQNLFSLLLRKGPSTLAQAYWPGPNNIKLFTAVLNEFT
jgi:hypothetical protein